MQDMYTCLNDFGSKQPVQSHKRNITARHSAVILIGTI